MGRRNYNTNEIAALNGGIDYDSSPFVVPADCLISCSNVIPSTSVGGVAIRNGISKHNPVAIQQSSLSKAIVGLFSLYGQGGVNEFMVCQAGTKFYKNSPEGTWADITGSLTFTDSANNLTSFDVLNNILYCANRSKDQYWKWPLSGNGVAISDPPDGKPQFIVSFNRRIFCFGNSSFPLLADYSDIDDGTTFTDTNPFLNFDEGQGAEITGAVNRGSGVLTVFKNKSITFVESTGTTPPFTKYLFVDGIGCVSHQSIVTLPGGNIMWWDNDDIYMLIGNQVISATNHPTTGKPRLRNFFRNFVNQSRLKYVVGVYYPFLDIARFFYSTPNSNTNNAHIDFHVKTRSFWPGTLRGTSCCIRTISGQPRIYAGDTNGYAYRQDNLTSDDGSAIPWNARTPWQVFEGITIRKKLDLIDTIIDKQSNYDILCDVYLDQSNTAEIVNGVLSTALIGGALWDMALFDTDVFPQENNFMEATLQVNRLFKSISIDLHADGIDQPVNIHKIAFVERPLEFTRGTS